VLVAARKPFRQLSDFDSGTQTREKSAVYGTKGLQMTVTETLELLDTLEDIGFTDDAFWRLHHKREPTAKRKQSQKETIAKFRAYCEGIQRRTDSFKYNSENEHVHERLKFVLRKYREGGYAPRQTNIFIALAEEAFLKIPPRKETKQG